MKIEYLSPEELHRAYLLYLKFYRDMNREQIADKNRRYYIKTNLKKKSNGIKTNLKGSDTESQQTDKKEVMDIW